MGYVLSIILSTYSSMNLSIRLSSNPSIHPSIHPSSQDSTSHVHIMAHVYTSTLWAHLRALEPSSSDIEKCESQLPASAKHQVMTGHGPLEPSCPQNGAPSHIVNLQGVQLVQKNPEKIGRCHHIIIAISAQIPKPRAKQPKKS